MPDVIKVLGWIGLGSLLFVWFFDCILFIVGGIASLIGLKQLLWIKIGPMTPFEAVSMLSMGITFLSLIFFAFLPRKAKNHSAKSQN